MERLTGLADPAIRADYTAQHRNDNLFRRASCQYVDPLTGVTCGHGMRCLCHSYSISEQEAGINDILAHDWVGYESGASEADTPTAKALRVAAKTLAGQLRYLDYAPGTPEWLTSPAAVIA